MKKIKIKSKETAAKEDKALAKSVLEDLEQEDGTIEDIKEKTIGKIKPRQNGTKRS